MSKLLCNVLKISGKCLLPGCVPAPYSPKPLRSSQDKVKISGRLFHTRPNGSDSLNC